MSVEALTFLPPISMPSLNLTSAAKVAQLTTAPASTLAAASGQFAAAFSQQLSQVNTQLLNADHGVQQLAAGDATNLHQVMINLEQAKLSMQLVMQVRNHVLDAYRELLQMQV
ncbi:MAG: flagellar hook-basal body complex protein FliE [Pseudomonadota bacterium]